VILNFPLLSVGGPREVLAVLVAEEQGEGLGWLMYAPGPRSRKGLVPKVEQYGECVKSHSLDVGAENNQEGLDLFPVDALASFG
jgi:hypothetical protein